MTHAYNIFLGRILLLGLCSQQRPSPAVLSVGMGLCLHTGEQKSSEECMSLRALPCREHDMSMMRPPFLLVHQFPCYTPIFSSKTFNVYVALFCPGLSPQPFGEAGLRNGAGPRVTQRAPSSGKDLNLNALSPKPTPWWF